MMTDISRKTVLKLTKLENVKFPTETTLRSAILGYNFEKLFISFLRTAINVW